MSKRKIQKTLLDEDSSDQESLDEKLNTNKNFEDSDSEVIKLCNKLLKENQEYYRNTRDQIRKIKKLYLQDMKIAKKHMRKRKNNKKTGFTKDDVVPEKLAELIGVDKDTAMPRTKLTKEIYSVIKDRNLFYDKDKRVLRADKELMNIFNLSENVNKSTDPRDKNGFNFFNIQQHIAKCYKDEDIKKNNKRKKFNKRKIN